MQIMKMKYRRYDQPIGREKRLTAIGYCYYFF